MFTITFNGSSVMISEPSEVIVTHEGIQVRSLVKPEPKPEPVDLDFERKLEEIASLLPEGVGLHKKTGRKVSRNSALTRVTHFVKIALAQGRSRHDIIAEAKDKFTSVSRLTAQQYVYTAFKTLQPHHPTE